jgi:hypothetical protein
MRSENIPAGIFNTRFILTQMNGFCSMQYGDGNWIMNFSNEQVFINHKLAEERKVPIETIQRDLAEFLLRFDGIKEVYTSADMKREEYTRGKAQLLQMGFSHKASGDLLLVLEPAWLTGFPRGTTHGTGYTYDTHVPIVFMGWKIPMGQSSRYATITDIAPTLSMLLQIRLPNGATGQPIGEILGH